MTSSTPSTNGCTRPDVQLPDRIFTPVITLPIVDRAEELEWCLERGARTVLVRPAPVPGFRGSRSFGLEEFDPFCRPASGPRSRSRCTPRTADI